MQEKDERELSPEKSMQSNAMQGALCGVEKGCLRAPAWVELMSTNDHRDYSSTSYTASILGAWSTIDTDIDVAIPAHCMRMTLYRW